ncbi:hypothetical protein A2U01_0006259, partial [Trifolium medium]|nr:hypothetical protein [Trifolium medium]
MPPVTFSVILMQSWEAHSGAHRVLSFKVILNLILEHHLICTASSVNEALTQDLCNCLRMVNNLKRLLIGIKSYRVNNCCWPHFSPSHRIHSWEGPRNSPNDRLYLHNTWEDGKGKGCVGVKGTREGKK